jgi:hypothetical protein
MRQKTTHERCTDVSSSPVSSLYAGKRHPSDARQSSIESIRTVSSYPTPESANTHAAHDSLIKYFVYRVPTVVQVPFSRCHELLPGKRGY